MNKATMAGYIEAADNTQHPLQTRLRLVLTPFTPNANNQGIPQSEAENFARTAINMPLKIRLTPYGAAGHDMAIPVGPIISAAPDMIGEESVIIGEAIVWKNEFPEVDQFLKTASKLDTSWEVYFSDSSIENDVEWLNGVVFSGTCVVENPAYKGKTPILAISEDQMEELKAQIADLTAQLEALKAEKNSAETSWSEEKASLENTVNELSSKVKSFEDEKAAAAAESRKNARREKLSEVMAEDKIEEALASYDALEDELFNRIVGDMKSVLSNKTQSSDKQIRVPDSTHSNDNVSDKELISALKALKSNRK